MGICEDWKMGQKCPKKNLKNFLEKLLTKMKSYYIILLAFRGKRKFARRLCEAGCGSAWLERLVWDQEVAGSNPVTPIKGERLTETETSNLR